MLYGYSEGLYREDVEFDSNTPDYKVAAVRNLFDSDIYEEFAQVFGAGNIIEHEVDLTTVDMQKDYGEAVCKVRPLTFDEVRKYKKKNINSDGGLGFLAVLIFLSFPHLIL